MVIKLKRKCCCCKQDFSSRPDSNQELLYKPSKPSESESATTTPILHHGNRVYVTAAKKLSQTKTGLSPGTTNGEAFSSYDNEPPSSPVWQRLGLDSASTNDDYWASVVAETSITFPSPATSYQQSNYDLSVQDELDELDSGWDEENCSQVC